VARDRITAAEKVAGGAFPFAEFHKAIMSDHQHAEKENGLVYHVRVPDASELGPIDKAVMAKPAPVNSPMLSSFTGECHVFNSIQFNSVLAFIYNMHIVSRRALSGRILLFAPVF